MRIVIPSRGRAGNVRTLSYFPDRSAVTLVVPESEEIEYDRHCAGAEIVTGTWDNIGQKRQFVLDRWASREKILMLDDDLRFRVRRGEKFATATSEDVIKMIRTIDGLLDTARHVGIADEFMCQHNPPGLVEGKRYNQVLGYNFVGLKDVPHFRLMINEEHDMHLQLLRLGHRPVVLTDFTKGSLYQASGGCSTWRTGEVERDEFEKFRALWPDVVTIVPNANSCSGLATRVAWRRAA